MNYIYPDSAEYNSYLGAYEVGTPLNSYGIMSWSYFVGDDSYHYYGDTELTEPHKVSSTNTTYCGGLYDYCDWYGFYDSNCYDNIVAFTYTAAVDYDFDVTVDDFISPVTDSGLECSMDGYTEMMSEILELTVFLVSFSKEVFAAMLSDALNYSLNYAYDFLMSAGDWIGYLLASTYFVTLEMGDEASDWYCEMWGYGYYVIDGLQVLVSFAESY